MYSSIKRIMLFSVFPIKVCVTNLLILQAKIGNWLAIDIKENTPTENSEAVIQRH